MKSVKFVALIMTMALICAGLALPAAAAEEAGVRWVPYQWDESGQPTGYVLKAFNGGEEFDPAALTYASVDQWKIDLINAQTMNPRTTGYEKLDAVVDATLAKIIRDDMTNYQKLLAAYNYIVRESEYAVPLYGPEYGLDNDNQPETKLMSFTDCVYGYYLLTNKEGVCDEFSAAFVAMANRIGFEAYDMAGWVSGSGHGWSVIKLGESYYIFDTQAEQANIKNNQVRYMNFCLNTSTATQYVPVEGCLAEQRSYR